MADVKAIAKELVELTVKEVNELKQNFERRVWYRTSSGSISSSSRSSSSNEVVEEKTSFDVVLKSAG